MIPKSDIKVSDSTQILMKSDDMHILERYIDYLKNGDPDDFDDQSTDDAIFHDEAPAKKR